MTAGIQDLLVTGLRAASERAHACEFRVVRDGAAEESHRLLWVHQEESLQELVNANSTVITPAAHWLSDLLQS